MKPLILSFFAVILGYSLFIDKEKKAPTSAYKPKVTATPQTSYTIQPLDSISFYANRTVKIF